jgi:hypothetical protein
MNDTRDKRARHFFLLGCFHEAIENLNYDRAYYHDQLHYQEIIRSSEDWHYWNKWQRATIAKRLTLCAKLLGTVNTLDVKMQSAEFDEGTVLAALPNYSGLAHEQQFSRSINKLSLRGEKINLHVAYGTVFDKQTQERAAKLYRVSQLNVHFIGRSDIENNGKHLDTLATNLGAKSILFLSLYYYAFWNSLYITKTQTKFLAMKYYPLRTPNIKSYYSGLVDENRSVTINNTSYIQLPVLDAYFKLGPNQFAKPSNSSRVTFGSISRAEKLLGQVYNQSILTMLNRQQNAEYIYTGSPPAVDLIPRSVKEHNRSRCLGWVDPKSAIDEYDIYLDPFPWGGGDMTLLALSRGKPYLTLVTEESSNHVGIQSFLKLISASNPTLAYSFCRSTEELHYKFSELSSDSTLRGKLGLEWLNALKCYKPSVNSWEHLLDLPTGSLTLMNVE